MDRGTCGSLAGSYLLRHDHVVVLRPVDGLRPRLWASIVEQGIVVVHHDGAGCENREIASLYLL